MGKFKAKSVEKLNMEMEKLKIHSFEGHIIHADKTSFSHKCGLFTWQYRLPHGSSWILWGHPLNYNGLLKVFSKSWGKKWRLKQGSQRLSMLSNTTNLQSSQIHNDNCGKHNDGPARRIKSLVVWKVFNQLFTLFKNYTDTVKEWRWGKQTDCYKLVQKRKLFSEELQICQRETGNSFTKSH